MTERRPIEVHEINEKGRNDSFPQVSIIKRIDHNNRPQHFANLTRGNNHQLVRLDGTTGMQTVRDLKAPLQAMLPDYPSMADIRVVGYSQIRWQQEQLVGIELVLHDTSVLINAYGETMHEAAAQAYLNGVSHLITATENKRG